MDMEDSKQMEIGLLFGDVESVVVINRIYIHVNNVGENGMDSHNVLVNCMALYPVMKKMMKGGKM